MTATINETMSKSIGFFTHFSFDFTIDKTLLDILYFSMFKNRLISPLVEDMTSDDILTEDSVKSLVDLIETLYTEKWTKVKTALSLDYDTLKPRENETIVTDTQNADTNNKIYGFDSETGVNDSSATAGKTENRTETTKSRGNITPQTLILNEINFRQYSFIQSVFKDINNLITLDIY